MILPQGSTIRSVKETVTEEYVRAILSNVASCDREMGDAVVVLSLTGDGRFPDYDVRTLMDADTGQTMTWQSFSGKTHKPLRPNQETRAFWSCESMTLQEVSALLGEIRGFKAVRKDATRA